MERQLAAFMAVYETRNFSQAARQLFISQPSVSVQINQLENQLGVTLFERNGRRQVQPTKAADQLYIAYQRQELEWHTTLEQIKQTAKHARTNAILGFSQTTSVELLPRIMPALLAANEYQFTIQTMNSSAILERVVNRQLAYGIIEQPMLADYVVQTEVSGDQLVLAGDPATNLWLFREPGSGVRHYTEAYLHEQGIVPEETLVVDSNQAILGLLAAGIGKTLMSREIVPAHVTTRALSSNYQRQFYLIGVDQQPNQQLAQLRDLIETALTTMTD